MESRRFVSCSVCGTALVSSGPLVNPPCYKCRTPVQVNSWKSNTCSSRTSSNLSWRSSSGREQEEDAAADGRKTPETGSRRGTNGFLLPPPGRSVVGTEDKGRNNLSLFESTMDRLAVNADRSLKMATSDSEASRATQQRPKQPMFSSSQSVVSSEDTMDGDDNSSWNGDCPGSPHSSGGGSYEPSIISSEDAGYLSRGVSRRTRRKKPGGGFAEKVPAAGPGFGTGASDAEKSASSSRVLPQRRPYTSGSIADSSSNGSHAREPSSSSSWGSGDLSRFNAWTGSGNDNSHAYNSSSSGDLSRLAEIRASQYRSGSKSPQVMRPGQLVNGEGSSGRTSLDGLQEVNPYGLNSASSAPQASHGTHFPPPTSSTNHKQASPCASRSIHCCMHCRSKACGVFEQFPDNMCCANGSCSFCSHSCCQPPTSTNSGQLPQCHGKPNPFISSLRVDEQVQDGSGVALKAMEKKKQHLKQVFGGAGFLMCYECEELMQMPKDFHFSRSRRNRMRCGNCSLVVEYMLVDKTRIVPYKFAIDRKIVPGEEVDRRSRVANTYAASPASSAGDGSSHSRRDRISYTENYSGYSNGGGGSTEGEAECQSRKAMRKREADVLHRLMGYFSARDIMYEAEQ